MRSPVCYCTIFCVLYDFFQIAKSIIPYINNLDFKIFALIPPWILWNYFYILISIIISWYRYTVLYVWHTTSQNCIALCSRLTVLFYL